MSSKRERVLFFAEVLVKLCETNNITGLYFIAKGEYWIEDLNELKALNKADLNSGSFIIEFPSKNWIVGSREILECTESDIEGWFYANLIQSSF